MEIPEFLVVLQVGSPMTLGTPSVLVHRPALVERQPAVAHSGPRVLTLPCCSAFHAVTAVEVTADGQARTATLAGALLVIGHS